MTQFGRYDILNEIGRGGFATVYKAHDTRLKRTVALKILHAGWSGDTDFVRRFQQEAETIANLRHPNIVVIYDVGEVERQLYIAMEYLAGDDLQAWLKKVDGSLLAADCLPILRPVAAALDYAHSRGVIHRDIKPSNIMRDGTNQTPRIVLTDFGLVKAMENSLVQTKTGQMLGSPAYMSPEQADPNRSDEIGPQSDLYAFGIIAYQMLAGRVPFPGDSISTLYAHVNLPVPDPQQLNPELSDEVVAILGRMLAKTAAERYPTALAFVSALQATLEVTSEEQVIPLYAQLQQVHTDGDWVQVLTLATQIELLLPGYRDVAAIQATARQRLQTPKPKPVSPSVVETPKKVEAALEPKATKQSWRPPQKEPAAPLKAEPQPQKEGLPGYVWLVGGVVGIIIIGILYLTFFRGSTPTPTPTPVPLIFPANPTPGSTFVRPTDRMTMVYVPGGSFMMGSDPDDDPDADSDEQPQHEVTLDGFWIDRTEVTNAKYNICVQDGSCEPSEYANNTDYNGDDHPVVGVSWNDAEAYCEWVGGQLPTEAQWEYAARGDDGRLYPWGNVSPTCDLAQFSGCDGDTVQVGTFSPAGDSWVGAQDMSGNVWEWVADWYAEDYYANAPATNPNGSATGDRKVLRGGGWGSSAQVVRSAYRSCNSPSDRDVHDGFRCAAPGK